MANDLCTGPPFAKCSRGLTDLEHAQPTAIRTCLSSHSGCFRPSRSLSESNFPTRSEVTPSTWGARESCCLLKHVPERVLIAVWRRWLTYVSEIMLCGSWEEAQADVIGQMPICTHHKAGQKPGQNVIYDVPLLSILMVLGRGCGLSHVAAPLMILPYHYPWVMLALHWNAASLSGCTSLLQLPWPRLDEG